jgi:DnaJ-class molecular chaperone
MLTDSNLELGWKVLGGEEEFKKVSPTKLVSQFLNGGDINTERISAKNQLLIHMIQTNQNKNLQIFLKNVCKKCNGIGFDISIFTTINVKCPDCKGTGWLVTECRTCKGTGKIGEIPCYTCKGTGIYIYKETINYPGKKCLRCNGEGMIKMLVQKIEDIKICPNCKGTGVFKIAENPVIEEEIGMALLDFLNKK